MESGAVSPLSGRWSLWSVPGRLVVFILSATSIWCLLAEFYGLCSMRDFTLYISIPAGLVLIALAAADALAGDGRLLRGILIGAAGGLIAAVAYDLFRLPFVFARSLGITAVVPPLDLFKVFPRFGAMILGQPVEQESYTLAAHLVGWAYHFSNGLTFGVMYTALIGEGRRRHWAWAVLLAVGLELGMLLTPYPQFFGIRLGPAFLAATLAAHLVFGVALGLFTRWASWAWPDPRPA
ncbi:MAG: hypothetical protein IRY99_07370 [Isosphaeraceae bacterium]|nr:hypothetical protein [Isosphaeraceae bacterium]